MAVYVQTTLECGHFHNPASYPGPIGGRNRESSLNWVIVVISVTSLQWSSSDRNLLH
jgi:hypothetical protein